MKKKSLSILIALALTTSTALTAAPKVFADTTTAATTTAPASTYGVEYEGQVQNIGWQSPVTTTGDQTDITTINPAAGTEGQSLRVETLKITGTNLPAGASLTYQAHVQNIGWQSPVTTTGDTPIDSAAQAGTVGQSLRMEAFKLTLNGMPGYAVKYQAHVQNIGWQPAVTTENGTDISNAAAAGTEGQSLRMEALRIEIVKTDAEKTAEVNAINAVNAAVASKEQSDIDAANAEIAAVQDTTEKTALTNQLNGVVSNLEVDSITDVNAKQIKVAFTQPVDKTTAENGANYTFSDGNTVVAGGAQLQSDNKTVLLTLTNGYASSTNVAVTVASQIQLKGDSTKVNPLYSKTININDTTPASITAIKSSTNGTTAAQVEVDFSEPVASAVLKVDGTNYPTVWTKNNTVATISGLTLDATKAHTLDAVALTDYANNVTNLLNQSFNVTTDTTAPVATVSAKDDHNILLTFNKPMNVGTVENTGAVIVKDEGLNTVTTGTVTEDTADETSTGAAAGTMFIVPVTDATIYSANSQSSRNFTVLLDKSITDSLSNPIGTSDVTKAVTLNEDKTAPVVNSVTYKTQTDGKVTDIVLNMSKGVAAGTYSSTGITIVNSNGVANGSIVLPSLSNAAHAGDTTVTYHLASAAAISGSYTFYIPANLITDNSFDANKNTANTVNANFANTSTAFNIKQSNISQPTANTIQVAFGTPVQGGQSAQAATNPANYTIAGSALPAGSILSLDPTMTTLTITLPATGSIAKTDANTIFTISGVQNSNGTAITPFTGTLNLTDNTAPVLQSANVVDNQHIILNYNEAMKAYSAMNAGTDFTITNGNSTWTLGASDLTVSTVPGFANELELGIAGTPATAGTPEVYNLTVGGATTAGNITVGGKTVPVTASESATDVAAAIVTAFNGNATWTVTNTGANVTFTAKAAAADTAITTADTGATGVTFAGTDTTPGVAPTAATGHVLDLTKPITITAKNGSTIVKDLAGNNQAASSAITVTK